MESTKKPPRTWSLRSLLIAIMVCPMILATAAIGTLSYTQGRAAMKASAESLFTEVNERIGDHLATYLDTADLINRVNVEGFATGQLDIGEPRAIEGHLIALLRAHPTISSTYVGSTRGGIVDAGREGAGGQEYVIETPGFAAGAFVKSSIDRRGNKVATLLALPSFDARSRPWYRAALAEDRAAAPGKAVWTDIFSLFSGQDSAISSARPLHDSEGNFIGVSSVDLFLSQIGSFLGSMEVKGTGKSFLMDGAGLLVASPADSRLYSDPGKGQAASRLRAEESTDPLIAAAARRVAGSGATIGVEHLNLGFTFEGERHVALVSRLPEPAGLGWLIVSVFPESAFTEFLKGNLVETLMLTLLATLCFALLAVIMAASIGARAREFSSFADAVAEGRWKRGGHRMRPTSLREVETLRGDLLSMGESLENSFARLRAEIDERSRAEQRLRESQRAYDRLTRNIPVGVYLLRSLAGGGFRYEYISPRFREIFGLAADAVFTGPESDLGLIHPEDRASFLAVQEKALAEARTFWWEGRILIGNETRYIRKHSIPEVQENGDVLWDGMLIDISESRLAEERIKSLLAEKELLLREVHHRIKNNMNTVAAMLAFQAEMQEDSAVSDILHGACDRIGSMMLLYNRLYRSDSGSTTDAALYLGDLATQIETHQSHQAGISIRRELEPLVLDARKLTPLGIIANELLTNAYKHAFPQGRGGEILLALKVAGDQAKLTVTDDGIGSEGPASKPGFGTALVEGLTQQLGGVIRESRERGTSIEISFPIEARAGGPD